MKTVTIKTTIVCVSLIVIGLFFANLSYAAMDLETLVGLWLFDDGKGDTAKDTSGNGNDGTLINGPKWVNGKFGKALEFDGSDDYVQVQDADSLDMDDEITVMFWFKTNKKMVDRWADRQVVVGKHYLEYEVVFTMAEMFTHILLMALVVTMKGFLSLWAKSLAMLIGYLMNGIT